MMNLAHTCRVAGLLAALFLVSGCVKVWRESIDIKTYMIEARRSEPARATPLGQMLWIDAVNVLPPSNVRNLVLRESDVEFSTSYYAELLMSPSENFRNELFGWLSTSGLFEEVSIVGRAGASHSLHATVMEFYADLPGNQVALRIKATLFDETIRGDRVLFSKDYVQVAAYPENRAEELVRAYNKALAALLSDLEQDMAAALAKPADGSVD